MKSNILVKAGAAFLVLGAILVVIKKNRSDGVENFDAPIGGGEMTQQAMEQVQIDGGQPMSVETLSQTTVEGDTEEDTMRTLIAEVRGYKSSLNDLREQNQQIRRDNDALRNVEESIAQRVAAEVAMSLQQQEETIDQRINRAIQSGGDRMRGMQMGRAGGSDGFNISNGTLWVSPIDKLEAETDGDIGEFGLPRFGMEKDAFGINPLAKREGLGNRGASRARGESGITPMFTIPKNATLVGTTALTALVGRVPIGKNVSDPYRFKVIIGADNLAANGIEVPGVAHAVMSGNAIGDWTLGCVRGRVDSMTFIFDDGTIRTVPKPSDDNGGGDRSGGVKIGDLSDNFGNPCVMGKRITNAYSYLGQRIGISMAAAAADAAAAAQTSSVGGDLGTAITTVDGSTADYVLGKTLAGSANEVAEWLDERQAQEFDAVYVAPGHKVAIHITQEIRVDYDEFGRKTTYTEMAFKGDNRELD